MLKSLAIQDYIKTITSLSLNERKDVVKLNEVAKKLNVSSAAVSDMIKKLVKESLVINHAYKGVELTELGMAMGKLLIRNHRLWEVFLHQFLKMPWDQVHDEAENLEHAASEQLMDRIDSFLDFPTVDPHGNPIPDKKGVISYHKKEITLFDSQVNYDYKILRVVAFDSDYLNYIASRGVAIDQQINIKLKFDDSLVCVINNQDISIANDYAQKIFVVPA